MIFELPYPGRVSARIYDVRGRLVRELLNANRPAGRHELAWEAQEREGHRVPPGVYFIRLESGEWSAVQKVTVLR
jgi:flagellar hook assembly protein FlgD